MYRNQKQIRQYCFGNTEFEGGIILLLKRNVQVEAYEKLCSGIQHFSGVWTGFKGIYKRKTVYTIVAGVGPTAIADCILAIGRTSSIAVYAATCGGLKENQQTGGFVVPVKGYGDITLPDIIKKHVSLPPEIITAEKTAIVLNSTGIPGVEIGDMYSTSSFVAENQKDFFSNLPSSAIAIDMETATFAAAAEFTGIRFFAYHWITDLPNNGKSFYDSKSLAEKELCEKLFKETPQRNLEIITQL